MAATLLVEPSPLGPEVLEHHLSQVDEESAEIRSRLSPTASAEQMLAALNRHFFGEVGFEALQDLNTVENASVAAVLDKRRGTCMGLAIVYLALSERLGLSAHAVATPIHLFMRVELPGGSRNVELLEEGREISDDFYRRRNRIADSSIERGVFLRNLTADEIVAHLLSNQAIALARDGRLDDALARYDVALRKAPLLVAAWYNRGIDLMSAGRLEEALANFDRAIDLHPNDAQAHNNRGIAKARMGDLEGARADWQSALKLEPGMREAYDNLRKLEPE